VLWVRSYRGGDQRAITARPGRYTFISESGFAIGPRRLAAASTYTHGNG
jgi:hypothetical protein